MGAERDPFGHSSALKFTILDCEQFHSRAAESADKALRDGTLLFVPLESEHPPDASTGEAEAEAGNRIAEFLNRWKLERQPFSTVPPPQLWHYTDVAGLMGVLSTSELSATNVSYLNNDRTALTADSQAASRDPCFDHLRR